MTLLSIVADAATEVGINVPSTVIGNGDPAIQRMYRHANRVGADLVSRAMWSALRTERAWAADADTVQAAALTGITDLSRIIPETFKDRTNQRTIDGPVPPSRWQDFQKAPAPTDFAAYYALRGGQVLVYPRPNGGEALAFEYISRNFCASSGGTPQQRWTADTDVARLPEELFTLGVIAFYLRSEGLPWEMASAEYEARIQTEVANDQPRVPLLATADIFSGRRAWDGIPAADAGANDPTVVIDYSLLG